MIKMRKKAPCSGRRLCISRNDAVTSSFDGRFFQYDRIKIAAPEVLVFGQCAVYGHNLTYCRELLGRGHRQVVILVGRGAATVLQMYPVPVHDPDRYPDYFSPDGYLLLVEGGLSLVKFTDLLDFCGR